MSAYRHKAAEVEFVLREVADLDSVLACERFAGLDNDSIAYLLEEAGRFAVEVLAPLNQTGDREGARWEPDGSVRCPAGFREAYRKYVDAGWGTLPFDQAHGGGEMPEVLTVATQGMFTGANIGWASGPSLTVAAGHLLQRWGEGDLVEHYLPHLVSGRWMGTMGLTEPQAGSALGLIETQAEPVNESPQPSVSRWRINGSKIFTSFGDHDLCENIVHLVLARIPDSPRGTKGVSLFAVPKQRVNADGRQGEPNGVTVVGLEEKLGLHGSPTCAMRFEEAEGLLIGHPNEGLRYMFTMMNLARIGVGMSAMAVADRSLQQAAVYATERRQGRSLTLPGAGHNAPIIAHCDVRRMLLTMECCVDAMRNLTYYVAAELDRSWHHPDHSTRERSRESVELLTPVCKAWQSDLASDVCSLGIQVHGGMGYIEATGTAQHYRDIRAAAIYEGTNGVQAIDLVGRKLPMRDGAAILAFIDHIRGVCDRLDRDNPSLCAITAGLRNAVLMLQAATDWIFESGLARTADVLAGASAYLRLLGYVAGGWMMALQAEAAIGRDDEFGARRLAAARYFIGTQLPQVHALYHAVVHGGTDLEVLIPTGLAGGNRRTAV